MINCDVIWCTMTCRSAVLRVVVYLEGPWVDEVLGTVDTVELSQAGLVVVNLGKAGLQLETEGRTGQDRTGEG